MIANKLTVGELVAFNMISSQLATPVLRIAQLWQEFQQVRLSIDRVGDILNTTPEPGQAGQANLPAIRGDISLRDVSFRYRLDSQPVVRNVSLDIPAGQVLGVVGSSGSGKSTLAKLIQRLYVPETGRVLVDGSDLSLTDPAWLRRQIGVVLQENILFNRTVRENIALADPGLPMERVIEAATLATSALDYESEAAIQANMRRICAGRTVILVAHRLSTLRGADRIITVEQGQIVEDGTHLSLLRAGGRYAQLWRLQSGDDAAPHAIGT